MSSGQDCSLQFWTDTYRLCPRPFTPAPFATTGTAHSVLPVGGERQLAAHLFLCPSVSIDTWLRVVGELGRRRKPRRRHRDGIGKHIRQSRDGLVDRVRVGLVVRVARLLRQQVAAQRQSQRNGKQDSCRQAPDFTPGSGNWMTFRSGITPGPQMRPHSGHCRLPASGPAWISNSRPPQPGSGHSAEDLVEGGSLPGRRSEPPRRGRPSRSGGRAAGQSRSPAPRFGRLSMVGVTSRPESRLRPSGGPQAA